MKKPANEQFWENERKKAELGIKISVTLFVIVLGVLIWLIYSLVVS